MARLGRFDDGVESGVERLAADLRERRPVEIDERRSDLRARRRAAAKRRDRAQVERHGPPPGALAFRPV